jgi:HEAT repeat protein
MTIDDALRFLAAHQPMPPTSAASDALIAEFDSVRRFLAAHPDERAIPLLLGAFGEGDLHGVYPLVEDALRPYPRGVVVPYIVTALSRGGESVRSWAAQVAALFPDPRLLPPLTDILRSGNADQRIAAITALEQLGSREARDALNAARTLPLEPEVREMLDEVTESMGGR